MTFLLFHKHAVAIGRAPSACSASGAAVTGYLIAQHRPLTPSAMTALAVFILASGASALNQYQERHIDARMERTRLRPLPAGVINPPRALFLALMLICAGLALLAVSGGVVPATLGMLAVVWYNGAYTYLKRITAFAAVPGAIVGMIPPAIGWAAAGGGFADPRLLAVCFLFFMWQVPHFWLQILHHGEEYEHAGLPSLSKVLGKQQIARITFAWICSASVSSLLLPLYGNLASPLLYGPLLFISIWTMAKGAKLVTARRSPALSLAAFRQLNIFIFTVMSLLSAEMIFFHAP